MEVKAGMTTQDLKKREFSITLLEWESDGIIS